MGANTVYIDVKIPYVAPSDLEWFAPRSTPVVPLFSYATIQTSARVVNVGGLLLVEVSYTDDAVFTPDDGATVRSTHSREDLVKMLAMLDEAARPCG